MRVKAALVLASILTMSVIATQAMAGPDPKSFQGKRMPRFISKDLQGNRITEKSFAGKVVLYDFWASWCGPCKAASPAMEALHKKYGKKGLMVVAANTTEYGADPVKASAKYVKEHGYTYKFTVENQGLVDTFGFPGIPAFVLVDKQGIVRFVFEGVPRSGPDGLYAFLAPMVEQLLARK